MITTIITISLLLAALAGIVTSCTLLWRKVVRPTWRFFRRLGQVVDVVVELPEWCSAVDEILLELKPNHGGSIKDKVHDIQARLVAHAEILSTFTESNPTNVVSPSITINTNATHPDESIIE